MPRSSRAALCALVAIVCFGAPGTVSAAEPATLVGQVVCPRCWHDADHDGDRPVTALAVRNPRDGSFRLIELREPPGGEAGWSAWIGKFVEVRGEAHGNELSSTRSVRLLPRSPWPPDAPVYSQAPTHGTSRHAHRHGEEAQDRSCDCCTPQPASKKPAARLPAWTDPSGNVVGLDAFRGSVVVLNFWATWCAPCVREMPDLVEIQERFAADGVQVVAAAAEPVEETERVVAFAERFQLNFPVLLGADAEQMESLGLTRALPSTAILDRDGNVVERIEGPVRPRSLRRTLRRIVNAQDQNRIARLDPNEQEPSDADEAEAAEPEPAHVETAEAHRGHDHDHGSEDTHGHPPNTDEASLVPS